MSPFPAAAAVLLVISLLPPGFICQIDFGDPFVIVNPEAEQLGVVATEDTITLPEYMQGVSDVPFEIGVLNTDRETHILLPVADCQRSIVRLLCKHG